MGFSDAKMLGPEVFPQFLTNSLFPPPPPPPSSVLNDCSFIVALISGKHLRLILGVHPFKVIRL